MVKQIQRWVLLHWKQMIRQVSGLGLLFLLALSLSGCVRYEVGIHFRDQHHGEIIQHLQLSQPLTSLNNAAAEEWVKTINRYTQPLGGQVRRLSKEEWQVVIPFNNGADLESKFNQFFQSIAPLSTMGDSREAESASRLAASPMPELPSHLALTERNFLFVLQDHLSYEVDLRALGVRSTRGDVLLSPGNLLDLEFRLNTPWGARSLAVKPEEPAIVQAELSNSHQLIWILKPGEINHLEATFWIPSPLGLGTVGIVGIAVLGAFLKSKLVLSTLD